MITEDSLDDCLCLLCDEKPIAVCRCIQSLEKTALSKPGLADRVVLGLIAFDIMQVKNSM